MTGDRVVEVSVDDAAEPTFQNESEQQVWDLLRRQLPTDAIVLPNLRLTDEQLDHEADLLVLVPGAGFVVVEVKGGDVGLSRATDRLVVGDPAVLRAVGGDAVARHLGLGGAR